MTAPIYSSLNNLLAIFSFGKANYFMETLLKDIAACTLCATHLPAGPRPVVQASPKSKILIIGQAPGRRVHASGIPFDDPSGDRLRQWLGIDRATFYNPELVGIMPMGFCYPGSSKSGDLPPRPECAPTWHNKLLGHLQQVEITLLVGKYALDHYLKPKPYPTLTETVRHWEEYLPYLPLVHPSPRNVAWHKKNPWFETEVVPHLQARVKKILQKTD